MTKEQELVADGIKVFGAATKIARRTHAGCIFNSVDELYTTLAVIGKSFLKDTYSSTSSQIPMEWIRILLRAELGIEEAYIGVSGSGFSGVRGISGIIGPVGPVGPAGQQGNPGMSSYNGGYSGGGYSRYGVVGGGVKGVAATISLIYGNQEIIIEDFVNWCSPYIKKDSITFLMTTFTEWKKIDDAQNRANEESGINTDF